MRRCRSSRRPSWRGPKETCHTPAAIASSPTYSPAPPLETFTHGRCHRRPPVVLTERTSPRAGSSKGGTLAGHCRGEEASRAAGGACRALQAGVRRELPGGSGPTCPVGHGGSALEVGRLRRCASDASAQGGRVAAVNPARDLLRGGLAAPTTQSAVSVSPAGAWRTARRCRYGGAWASRSPCTGG
jgi:hypothetical protein